MQNLLWAGLFVALTLLGCSDAHPPASPRNHVARTSGSAVALSADERVAVVCNRSAGVVSVVALDPEKAPAESIFDSKFEIEMEAGSEPWAAVIGADDDTAYVVFRHSQVVERITAIHSGTPMHGPSLRVGSEPTAIALSPTGKKLFVANFGEGTISVIDPEAFVELVKIDLNQTLVDTSTLGPVVARPALAHPRALAVTDNGDDHDEDETLYATEFFSQDLPGVVPTQTLTHVDRNRQGFVYPISLRTGQPGPAIPIAPVQDTGFVDGEDEMTGCFPNQLYAAAINAERLFVTSMCTSPRGPIGPSSVKHVTTMENFKTLFHPAVFVIDTKTNQEVPTQGRLLTAVLRDDYAAEDPAREQRMPLIPSDIAFGEATREGTSAFVSALGADALFRLDYDEQGNLRDIGSPGARFIHLNATRGLPVGVAVSKSASRPFALAVNDTDQSLSIVDRTTETVNPPSNLPKYLDLKRAKDFKDSDENQGHGFFGTGREVWSFKGQAWSSCESCHPNGLSDGVTWFFQRGPRRTISTAGTYDKNSTLSARAQRMMLWGANIDEVHDIEAIVRTVSGGPGAVLWAYFTTEAPDNECRLLYDGSSGTSSKLGSCRATKSTTNLQNGLNGSLRDLARRDGQSFCESDAAVCDTNGLSDWDQIDTFIRAERAPLRPTGIAPGEIESGRSLFRAGRCAACHGGPGWTISKLFYTPGEEWSGELPSTRPTSGPLALGALRQQTYSVPDELVRLNPAAQAAKQAGGLATYRTVAPPGLADADQIAFYYGAQYPLGGNMVSTPAADDQTRCTLRDVGTFPRGPAAGTDPALGIFPEGAPAIFEYRQNMSALAQGEMGFNPPALFGLSLGAPYFHAGNARTLEEVFDSKVFARHHQSLTGDFLLDPAHRAEQVANLVAYLLSIDENTPFERDELGDEDRDAFCTWKP